MGAQVKASRKHTAVYHRRIQYTSACSVAATTTATTIILTSSMFPSASVLDALAYRPVYDAGAEGSGS